MKKNNLLSPKEVAILLNIPLVTVSRWADQGKIPGKLKKVGYVFKKNELVSWARSHNLKIYESLTPLDKKTIRVDMALYHAVSRGGIHYNLEGNDIFSVFENAINKMDFIDSTSKEQVLHELVSREEITSTGIGNGVALPHPRRPMDLGLESGVIPVFFLKNWVDFNSVDGEPVFVAFFVFSPSTPLHVKLLSRLGFCLREKTFRAMLRKNPVSEVLLSQIIQIENKFEKR